MSSRGQANPRRGISVRSRAGGAPVPVQRESRHYGIRNGDLPDLARRRAATAGSRTTRPKCPKGWWCSTPCTRSRRSRPTTSPSAGTAKRGNAARVPPKSTATRGLMCMTRLNQLDLSKPVSVEPMRAFPLDQGSGHRRVVEFPGEEEHQALQAEAARRGRRHLADDAGRRRARAGVPEVHRVFSVPGRLPRAARASDVRRVRRAAASRLRGRAGDASARHREPRPRSEARRTASATATSRNAAPRSVPESITITDNAIIPLKERVIDQLYDPVAKLFRMLRR